MDTDEKSIQKVFSILLNCHNPNTDSGLSPVEMMFIRKI